MAYQLTRDCSATLIPAGDVVILEKGTSVEVTQALGGSVTIRSNMGLFRLAPHDLDALGTEALQKYALKSSDAVTTSGPLQEETLWAALRECYDPEIPVNLVDLGLIYDLSFQGDATQGHHVTVKMTLTAPGCGMGPVIAEDAKNKLLGVPGVNTAEVSIVWDPAWNPRMISPEGRKQLGLE
jgi:probable FeS assembly SUF system protein SufT